MSKVYKKSLKQKIRQSFYKIPDTVFDQRFEVKIAETKDEFEAAFRLLGQQSKELKCTLHSFLPQTITAIAKYKNYIVGTIVLVKDSTLGIPSDQYYLDENTILRHRGEDLIEVTNLAVDPGFRLHSESIQHLLMKFSYQFVRKFSYGSVLLMNTHPNSEDFFTCRWNFHRFGDVVKYKSAKSAYIVLLAWPVYKQTQSPSPSLFTSNHGSQRVLQFINETDPRMIFPFLKEGQLMGPLMTPELLEYFFVTKTSVYEELTLSARKLFLEIFLQFFGEEKIQNFLNIEREFFLKEYRTPTRATVIIKSVTEEYTGKIIDISSQGCFIELHEKLKNNKDELTLFFKFGEQNLSITGRASWRNENQLLRYPTGYGIQFHSQHKEIIEELQSWVKAS